MMQYKPSLVLTPGRRPIRVNVIQADYPVKQGKKSFVVPLVDESGIHAIAEIAKERVDEGRDCMIVWSGERGVGKSTAILKTGLKIDPNLDIDKIAYWLEDITKLFATNPQGDGSKGIYPQIVSDETGYALYGKQWQTRAQIEVSKNMIINRVMRQIFHVATPIRKQVNVDIRDMAFMWVHVSEPDYYKQGYAVVRLAPPSKQSEFHSAKYWEPAFAFVFKSLEGPLWDRYEARKVQFVKEASLLTASGRAMKGDKAMKARDVILREYYTYRKDKGDGITYEDLGRMIGLSKAQVWDIINQTPLS